MNELFNYNLNLSRLAIIRIAIMLWEQPLMKKKIKIFFIQFGYREILRRQNDFGSSQLTECENEIFSQIENLKLPVLSKQDLLCAARLVGENLFGWLVEVSYRLLASNNINKPTIDEYYDNVCWHYNIGDIDRVESYKLMYQNIIHDEELDVEYMLLEAMYYCLEYHISQLMTLEVVEALEKKLGPTGNTCFYHTSLKYWAHRYIDKVSSIPKDDTPNLLHIINKLAARSLNIFAVKYFCVQIYNSEIYFDNFQSFLYKSMRELSSKRYSHCSLRETGILKKEMNFCSFLINSIPDKDKKSELFYYREEELINLNKLWRYYNLVSFDTIYSNEETDGYEEKSLLNY